MFLRSAAEYLLPNLIGIFKDFTTLVTTLMVAMGERLLQITANLQAAFYNLYQSIFYSPRYECVGFYVSHILVLIDGSKHRIGCSDLAEQCGNLRIFLFHLSVRVDSTMIALLEGLLSAPLI